MELKPGAQLGSTCCSTQVVVVRPPSGEVEITCGGHPMVAAADAEATDAIKDGHDGGSQMGKRYQHEASGLELLCTKAGEGALAVDGALLDTKEAKAVPSSD